MRLFIAGEGVFDHVCFDVWSFRSGERREVRPAKVLWWLLKNFEGRFGVEGDLFDRLALVIRYEDSVLQIQRGLTFDVVWMAGNIAGGASGFDPMQWRVMVSLANDPYIAMLPVKPTAGVTDDPIVGIVIVYKLTPDHVSEACCRIVLKQVAKSVRGTGKGVFVLPVW